MCTINLEALNISIKEMPVVHGVFSEAVVAEPRADVLVAVVLLGAYCSLCSVHIATAVRHVAFDLEVGVPHEDRVPSSGRGTVLAEVGGVVQRSASVAEVIVEEFRMRAGWDSLHRCQVGRKVKKAKNEGKCENDVPEFHDESIDRTSDLEKF